MIGNDAFYDGLRKSYYRVLEVACAIAHRYPECHIHAPIMVRGAKACKESPFNDPGDLLVQIKDKRMRLEVKGVKHDLADFPYNRVFLGETYKVPESVRGVFVVGLKPRPIWYFKARIGWRQCPSIDTRDGRATVSWECPIEYAEVWE